MELLTAVNLILPKLGEHVVTSTTAKHPTLGIILPQMDLKRKALLNRGWWFNTQPNAKIFPDSASEIAVPVDTLAFYADDDTDVFPAIRGAKFWNSSLGTFKFTKNIEGTLVYDVPFNELPESAARAVLYSACVEAYLTDIGREPVVQEWKELAAQAFAEVERDHLRNRRYSTSKTPRWVRRLGAMRA